MTRAIWGAVVITTLYILAYIIRKPALRAMFNHPDDIPETPDDWQPRYWHNGKYIGLQDWPHREVKQ